MPAIVTVLIISAVLAYIGLRVVRWWLSFRPLDDADRCLLCDSLVSADESGGYRCRMCRFDAVRARAPAYKPTLELLRDLREARRSLALARRHYEWDRFEKAQPLLEEAFSLLKDLYRVMPELVGTAAAHVTGGEGSPVVKMLSEVPFLGLALDVADVVKSRPESEDPKAVKEAGLKRLKAWDATLVKARRSLAEQLALQMGALAEPPHGT